MSLRRLNGSSPDRENVQRLAAINGVVLPDSCFVPAAVQSGNYSLAVASWERESSDSLQPRSIVLGGTNETAISDTAEYEAIIIGATTDLPTQSLDAAALMEVSKFRKPLPFLRVQ